MTMLYPIVLETEADGAVSAYVAGAAGVRGGRYSRQGRTCHPCGPQGVLASHPASKPEARVRVARFSRSGKGKVEIVGVAALVGAKRTAAKARASRANGRLGGRPPKDVSVKTARRKA